MARVTVEGVTKLFGDVHALNDVSLTCEDGEFVVFLGASGSGKTTLLRIVAGLESATSGLIKIGDTVVNDIPPAGRDIAMVFQNYALYPHMRVRGNLSLALKRRKTSKPIISARMDSTTKLLGIQGLLERLPREMSGGQQQRVAVGRAIMREPRAFLMDEPLSNLDARLRLETRRELIHLHRQLQATFLYVTHDQTEAMAMASRVAILRDGVLNQFDPPMRLLTHPVNKYVAGFIGETRMNFITGTLQSSNGTVSLVSESMTLPLPSHLVDAAARGEGRRDVILGIRPEHLSLNSAETGALRATVDTFEPVGYRALMTATAGEATLVLDVPSHTNLAPGTRIGIEPEWKHAHLFDATTELALGH